MTETTVDVRGLRIEDIAVAYGEQEVLRGVSFRITGGELVAVTGASGSGKTTLLNVVAGLLRADAGTAAVEGVDGVEVGFTDVRRSPDQVGVILQLYGLVPVLTAWENVEIVLRALGVGAAERDIRIERVLAALGLAGMSNRLVEQLSGGQQQRVAVARGLVAEPAVLVADEPTSELDSDHRDTVLGLLRAAADDGAAVLLATHDREVATVCDRELRLVDGRVTTR